MARSVLFPRARALGLIDQLARVAANPSDARNPARAFSGANPEETTMSFGPMMGGNWYQPSGPYGPWAGCGCSSLFIILAGMLLVIGGCLRMVGF